MRGRVVGVGLALAGASGCWAFHTAATQTEGSDAAANDDGGGASADGAAGDDAAAVTGGDGDGGWCARQGTDAFCCDFDEDPLDADWDEVHSCSSASAITLDTHAWTSRPYSAFIMTSNYAECGSLTKQLGPFTHVTCAFDLRIDEATGLAYPSPVARLSVASSSGVYHADLVGSPSEARAVIVHGNSSATTSLAQGIGQAVWRRITMDFDVASPTATLSITVGPFGPVVTTLGSPTGVTGVALQLGMTADTLSPSNETWQLRFDDVLCTVVR